MSKEYAYRYIVNNKIADMVRGEVTKCSWRIDALVEQIKDKKLVELSLEELQDIAVSLRVHAEKL